MKVSLIILHDKPVTVGVGAFSFPIENDQLHHNIESRNGCEYLNQIDKYNEAFELAHFAWTHQMFDEVIDNTGLQR